MVLGVSFYFFEGMVKYRNRKLCCLVLLRCFEEGSYIGVGVKCKVIFIA